MEDLLSNYYPEIIDDTLKYKSAVENVKRSTRLLFYLLIKLYIIIISNYNIKSYFIKNQEIPKSINKKKNCSIFETVNIITDELNYKMKKNMVYMHFISKIKILNLLLFYIILYIFINNTI